VHLQNVFVCLRFIYNVLQEYCVYIFFNCMQFEKTIMWHSSVGFWVCYSMFRRENEIVLSCIVAQPRWSGTLQYGIRASIFNTEPGWVEQVELKRNFTED
jgi:hypothetical protein